TLAQQLRLVLQPPAHGRERGALPVPHGHHEPVAEKDHDLPRGDRVALRLVGDRFQHDEQRVVVDLQLGPLMGLEGVLHGQRVQPELARDQVELVRIRLVQPDPDEAARRPRLVQRVGEVPGRLRPPPLAIHRTVDDHGPYSPLACPAPHRCGRLPWAACPRCSWSGTDVPPPTPRDCSPAARRASPSTTAGPPRPPRCPPAWPNSRSARSSSARSSAARRPSGRCSTPARASPRTPTTASASATTATGRDANSPNSRTSP